MISFLRGVLVQCDQESIIVELSGIGYEVQIHNRTLASLPPVGNALLLHTYLQVLDNDFKLYGFISREELELFKILLGVSGIGARGALSILSAMKPADFYQAIVSSDEKRLLTVPGIGKKTAQRLVFELKDKVGKQQGLSLATSEDGNAMEEILEALEALGYQRSEIFPMIMDMKAHNELDDRVEENIKKVLRRKAMQMKK
ncbi:MAG: Holliday junction branch migration protein RuvA [Firmicutes bacterium HGW-Firmicutes-15]|nr:MAG: Holliday junction branch migration protein RuvA [Firmicutes bacterium HGW-Firmicutes-15]